MSTSVRFVDLPRCWAALEELEAGVPHDEFDDYFDEYQDLFLPCDVDLPCVYFDPEAQSALAITPVDSGAIPYGRVVMRARWLFGETQRARLEVRLAQIGQNIHTMRAHGHGLAFVRTVACLRCWASIAVAGCRALADVRGLVSGAFGWLR